MRSMYSSKYVKIVRHDVHHRCGALLQPHTALPATATFKVAAVRIDRQPCGSDHAWLLACCWALALGGQAAVAELIVGGCHVPQSGKLLWAGDRAFHDSFQPVKAHSSILHSIASP